MRARNIKPGFFKNEDLGDLDPLARLLFVGLWCMADKEGRMEDRPKRIKAEILPYDSGDIEKLLEQLHTSLFIVRYEDKKTGLKYIAIPNFAKHQNPHKNEKPSEIPCLTECREITGLEPEKHSTNPADSLIPDSLIPDSLIIPPISPKGEELFSDFWKEYPKKVGKGAAEKAWKKIKSPATTLKAILASLEWQKESEDWKKQNGQFIPNPSTYLSQRRWEDESPEKEPTKNIFQFEGPEWAR